MHFKVTSVAEQMLDGLSTDERTSVLRDVYDTIPHLPAKSVRLLRSPSLSEPIAVHEVGNSDLLVLYRFEDLDPADADNDLVVLGVLRKTDLETGTTVSSGDDGPSLTAQLNAYISS